MKSDAIEPGSLDDPVWQLPSSPERPSRSLTPVLAVLGVVCALLILGLALYGLGAAAETITNAPADRESERVMLMVQSALETLESSPTPSDPVVDRLKLTQREKLAIRERLTSGEWQVLDEGQFGMFDDRYVTVVYGSDGGSSQESVGVVYVSKDDEGWFIFKGGNSLLDVPEDAGAEP